jgi:ribonuclease P protein component
MGPTRSNIDKSASSLQHGRFPRAARILKSSEYNYVKLEGSRAYGQYLMLSYVTGRTQAGQQGAESRVRLGLAITKKVAVRAVDRNRFKRVLRDTFRRVRAHITAPIDIVVVARRDIASVEGKKVAAEFLALLTQEGLLPQGV